MFMVPLSQQGALPADSFEPFVAQPLLLPWERRSMLTRFIGEPLNEETEPVFCT